MRASPVGVESLQAGVGDDCWVRAPSVSLEALEGDDSGESEGQMLAVNIVP